MPLLSACMHELRHCSPALGTNGFSALQTHIGSIPSSFLFIYMYIYVCMFVCVCVYIYIYMNVCMHYMGFLKYWCLNSWLCIC
jgi:hypothetical protein